MREFDPKELRSALASYMTGVTVVTALSPSGEPVGFTANSFTSVSLNPPLLLVCPGKHLSSFEVFASATNFAVNVLAQDTRIIAAALVEQDGKLCVMRGPEGAHLPSVEAQDRSGARTAIAQHLSSLKIQAELGPVYSVFDDAENGAHVTVFRARLKQTPAIDGLEQWSISEPALTTLHPPANPQMMRRYQLEHRNNQFGLYIGDAVRGEVHHAEPVTK